MEEEKARLKTMQVETWQRYEQKIREEMLFFVYDIDTRRLHYMVNQLLSIYINPSNSVFEEPISRLLKLLLNQWMQNIFRTFIQKEV